MSTFSAEFFSLSLKKIVHFHAMIPNDLPPFMTAGNPNYDRPTKLLILLHGYNGSHTDWLYGTNINELAGKYNLAIVTPAGDNSFYLNDDAGFYNYCTYVGEELPNFVRRTFGISAAMEDTLIGGYSMGGFGALHTAAAYPDTFDKAFAFSSAMIIDNVVGLKPGDMDPVCGYEGYVRIFGDLSKLKESDKNPEVLFAKLKAEGRKIPEIYMACGLEDFLLKENRKFEKFLKEQGIPHEYHESHGIHNWTFWQSWLEPAICWMLGIEDKTTEDTIHLAADGDM